MQLTKEVLSRYVGGQLEIQNQQGGYLYRGEVAEVTVEGEGDRAEVKVKFAWVAKGEGYPPWPERWVKYDDLDYGVSLIIASASEIGDDRLCLNIPITGELAVFFPPNGSKLDPAKVEGLDLAEV